MDSDQSVTAILDIRRNADGRICRYPKTWEYFGDYIWADGNFRCDCNRYIFFCEAIGEPEVEDEDAPEHSCGHDRYSVHLTDVMGKVLYSEFTENAIEQVRSDPSRS